MRSTKHNNKPVTLDGRTYHSTLEGARYLELKKWQNEGRIDDLQMQVLFYCRDCNGQKVARYYADFVYTQDGKRVVEDVKGQVLQGFKMKAALLKAEGIEIQIVKANDIAKWAKDEAKRVRDGIGA